jgi:hypothetical protein
MTKILDAYCAICITGLSLLYLSVVRGALSVFDCSVEREGARFLSNEPSIMCDEVSSTLRLRDTAGCVMRPLSR